MTRIAVLPELDAGRYTRSVLHSESSVWLEKNCYVDIWIELIHALELNPIAMMAFTLAIDFEGDQWTFFKPVHSELRELYGIDVQELNVWRPLIEHAQEHLRAGKLISTEADAYWLPDTQGTDYRRQHTKTTIVLATLDIDARKLGYFHNAGYFELEGEDFARIFRLDAPHDPAFMPLFAESVRIDRLVRLSKNDLAERSIAHLRIHLARTPQTNPIARFAQRIDTEFTGLQAKGLDYYHAWAFANIRQLGAAAELAARYVDWLAQSSGLNLASSRDAFHAVSAANKTLILKAARAVNAKRALDLSLFEPMHRDWDTGQQALRDVFETSA